MVLVVALGVTAVGTDADADLVHTKDVQRATAQSRPVEGRRERRDDGLHLQQSELHEVACHDEGHLVVEVLARVGDHDDLGGGSCGRGAAGRSDVGGRKDTPLRDPGGQAALTPEAAPLTP